MAKRDRCRITTRDNTTSHLWETPAYDDAALWTDDGRAADGFLAAGPCVTPLRHDRDRIEAHRRRRASLHVPRLRATREAARAGADGARRRSGRPDRHARLERLPASGNLLRHDGLRC